MTSKSSNGPESDSSDRPAAKVGLSTVVLFLVGCVILVVAAVNIANLSSWSVRYGDIPVFLTFFLVMSIGGRWFWGGVDAAIAAVRQGRSD